MIPTDETTIKNARQRLKEIDKQNPSEMNIEVLREASHLQHIIMMVEMRGLGQLFKGMGDVIGVTIKEFEHLNETIEENNNAIN